MIRKQGGRVRELEQQLAEAQQQAEGLQLAVTQAEGWLMRARSETAERDRRISGMEAELMAFREAAGQGGTLSHERDAEAEELRSALQAASDQGEALGGQLRDAVLKYREVRLANAPEVPEDLVPPAATIAEIDRHFELAGRVVDEVRTRLTEEDRATGRVVLRPAGTPRRYPDHSSLSPAEKIRVGLKQLAEREAAEA